MLRLSWQVGAAMFQQYGSSFGTLANVASFATPNARHHQPAHKIKLHDGQRVAGRVHAVVRRGVVAIYYFLQFRTYYSAYRNAR